jgi:hypothetical protein
MNREKLLQSSKYQCPVKSDKVRHLNGSHLENRSDPGITQCATKYDENHAMSHEVPRKVGESPGKSLRLLGHGSKTTDSQFARNPDKNRWVAREKRPLGQR